MTGLTGRSERVFGSVARIAVMVVIGSAILLVAVAFGGAYFLSRHETQLIYFPSTQVTFEPRYARLPFEDVAIDVEPGVRIHGWFIKASREPTVATILFSHGNAGNIGNRVDRVESLRGLGVDFLLYDYRGFGASTGVPDEQGTYRDGRAAYDYLVKERHIGPSKIILMGESLGCAISMQLALDRKAAGLVLEAPFASSKRMAAAVYPFLPVGPFVKTRYDNLEKAPRLAMPLLVFHGTEDEVIPFPQGKMVADAAPEPKLFVSITGAHHSDVYIVGGEVYRRALGEFINHATAATSMKASSSTLVEPEKP